jgi:hypothetical protein
MTDTTLLKKINEAVAAANEAKATVSTARDELVSRSRAVGELLLEAKKLHPKVKDFEAFLKGVVGLGPSGELRLSRAYDMMRIAGGRATEEEIRKDARERKQKSRAKLPKPAPILKKPEPISVTEPHVTESSQSEKRKPEQTVFDSPQEAHGKPEPNASARALAEFTFACRTWLPKMTEADQEKAAALVLDLIGIRKAEAA